MVNDICKLFMLDPIAGDQIRHVMFSQFFEINFEVWVVERRLMRKARIVEAVELETYARDVRIHWPLHCSILSSVLQCVEKWPDFLKPELSIHYCVPLDHDYERMAPLVDLLQDDLATGEIRNADDHFQFSVQ